MATRTWDFKVADKTFSIKAIKADAEKLAREIKHFVCDMHEFTLEKSGTIGVDEYEIVTQQFVFGQRGKDVEPLPTEAEYQLDRTIYLAELPPVITDVSAEYKKVKTLFYKHLKVKDDRVTPAVKEAQQVNHQKMYQEQEEEHQRQVNEWLDARGISHEKIPIPEGMMAVYLQTTFNDSDAMSDYFNSHAPLGEKLLLALIPKQAETERVARAALARYPELLEHQWEWKTEKWSMGHGNYLISEFCGTEKYRAYNGRTEVDTRLEVEFAGSYEKEMYGYKGYPGTVNTSQSTPAAGNGKVIMTLNDERNGVELKFDSKPDDDTLNRLHATGFRFSRRQMLWYAKQSPSTLKFAEEVASA